MRSAADRIEGYLTKSGYFYTEKATLPYTPADGRFIFFISIYKVEEEIEKQLKAHLKEELGEDYLRQRRILHDVLWKPKSVDSEKSEERKMIEERLDDIRSKLRAEGKKQIIRFSEEKFSKSIEIERTNGLYNTLIDVFGKKDDNNKYIFEKWQKENTPYLANLEQGFFVEDACTAEPKCGKCGNYIFIRRTKEQDVGKVGDIETILANSEQIELADIAAKYVFREDLDVYPDMVNRFKFALLNLQGKPFRDSFDAQKLDSKKLPPLPPNLIIYKIKPEIENPSSIFDSEGN